MELTLRRLLEQAKFTTTRKGYDQDEVDDFLDKAVAMATKVEARLTQALADAKGAPTAEAAVVAAPTRSDEEIEAQIAAEVEKRVVGRLAEIEAASPAPAADDTAAVEEATRTLLLAQRTADAAVAEAREEAAQIVAAAQTEAQDRRRESADELERERADARSRLADEIGALEQARDGLRADVSSLESHVEEQRLQLRSAVAELQRLLDDPAAFRLAPAPVVRDVAIPGLFDTGSSSPDAGVPGAGTPEPSEAPQAAGASAPVAAASPPATVAAPAAPGPAAEASSPSTPADEVSEGPHPDVDSGGDPEASLDAGPPTAPVAAVDLGLGGSADPVADAGGAGEASDAADGDDNFLAELRKAMADEEPLGPRDVESTDVQLGFLEEERRGWRFGKRR